MTTIKGKYGITLSAHAGLNDAFLMPVIRYGGDFASRLGGRIRRADRRDARRRKMAFLLAALRG